MPESYSNLPADAIRKAIVVIDGSDFGIRQKFNWFETGHSIPDIHDAAKKAASLHPALDDMKWELDPDNHRMNGFVAGIKLGSVVCIAATPGATGDRNIKIEDVVPALNYAVPGIALPATTEQVEKELGMRSWKIVMRWTEEMIGYDDRLRMFVPQAFSTLTGLALGLLGDRGSYKREVKRSGNTKREVAWGEYVICYSKGQK